MAYLEKDVGRLYGLKQAQIDMLYDPQTSGGLLLQLRNQSSRDFQYQLGEKGCENAVIWKIQEAHIALHRDLNK